MKCCVLSCKNYSDNATDGVTFHLFPSEDNLRQKWIAKMNRPDWTPTKYTKICSCHFDIEDFRLTKKGLKKLMQSALPRLRLDVSINRESPEPEPSLSNTSECSLFNDVPRKRLIQEIAHHKYKARADNLKIRRLQMQVHRLKKKYDAHSDVVGISAHKGAGSEEGAPLAHYSISESTCGVMRYTCEAAKDQEAVCARRCTSTGTLQQEILMDMHQLSDKIQSTFQPLRGKHFTFTFKGADGDACEYIFVSTSTKRGRAARHRGVSCNQCGDVIRGRRYSCVSCVDYDVCEACETLGVHSHHPLVRIATPITAKRAQDLLKRWREALKAAGADTIEDLVAPTAPPPSTAPEPTSQQFSGGDPNRFDAHSMNTSDYESVNKWIVTANGSPIAKKQKITTKKTSLKDEKLGMSKSTGKAATANLQDSTEPSESQEAEDSDDETEESDDSMSEAEPKRNYLEVKEIDTIDVTVKTEPDGESMALTSFDETEVMLDEVKVEYPDPLDPGEKSCSTSTGRSGSERPTTNSIIDSSFCETYVHRKLDY